MTITKPGSTIGIIGGGQLGRMIANAASELGYKVCIYTDQENSPASHVAHDTIVSAYNDKNALNDFISRVDVITLEFENIPHQTAKQLEEMKILRPGWKILHIIQNRLREKDFINSIGIKTAPYEEVNSLNSLQKAYAEIEGRCILKTAEFGYDGKGQFKINENTDLTQIWNDNNPGNCILEGMVDFECEISVVIARGEDGKTQSYPSVENRHKDGILDETIAPANINKKTEKQALDIANNIAEKLDIIGVLAVEMFVMKDGNIMVNELAPRPHNSGHWTMNGSVTSQFEQLVRAVCGLPLGSTEIKSKVIMKNLIGDEVNLWEELIKNPNNKIHLYGKQKVRAGRKMGHVNKLLN